MGSKRLLNMKKNKTWIIIVLAVLLIMSQAKKEGKKMGPGGVTLVRTVTPSEVQPGGIFTLRYTIAGATEDYGGIAYETIPDGFIIDHDTMFNNFPMFVGDTQGQVMSFAFVGSTDNKFVEYQITAPNHSGVLSEGNVQWANGTGTDLLDTVTLNVIVPSTCEAELCSASAGECRTGSCVGNSCEFTNKADSSVCSTGTCNSGICVANVTSCTPDWQCTPYSACSSGCVKTRTCSDVNECNTTFSQPPSSENCTGGACNTMNTCSQLGGTICTSSQTCSANIIQSYDSNLCCTGNCQSSLQPCSVLGGTMCSTSQDCIGGAYATASDSVMCCIGGTCTTPTASTKTCEERLSCQMWESCNSAKNKCGMASWAIIVLIALGIIFALKAMQK